MDEQVATNRGPRRSMDDAATRRLLRLLWLAARISKERGVSVEKLCEPTAIPEAAKANGESAEGSKKRNQEAAP